jgi:hypothetical protein
MMKQAGFFLVGVGILLLIGAFFVDVSRQIDYMPSLGPYTSSFPREVANVHAMHIQALVVHGGLAAIIAGIIAIGFGTLDERLANRSQGPVAPEVPAEQPEGDSTMLIGAVMVGAIIIVIILALTQGAGGGTGYTANGYDENQATMDAANDLETAANEVERAARDIADETERAARER